MKYLPLILVVFAICFVIWLDYANHHLNREPKWIVANLPGDRKAVTMPPFGIYIEPDVKNSPEVIAHEKCHWNQYRNKGLYKFYADYINYKKTHTYEENPMESECFKFELL